MEKVRRSGAFYIALLGHIDDSCDNLNDAQKELTEILSDLKVEQSSQKEDDIIKELEEESSYRQGSNKIGF